MKLIDKIKATRLAIEKVIFEDEVSTERKLERRYFVFLVLIFLGYFLINLYHFLTKPQYIKFLLPANNYSTITLKEILFSTDLSKPIFDMPIYNIVLKVLSYFFDIKPFFIFLLNSFIAFFGILGFYLLIAKTRNEKSGLLGVVALLSTSFFWEITRHPSPDVITFTSLIWSYYYYIRMKSEEQYNSVTNFIFFYSLGLLSDKFFVIYTLPCLSFLSFLFNTIYSNRVIYIFVPSVLISFIFYLRFLIVFIIKHSFIPLTTNYFNFKEALNVYIEYFGLIPFVLSFGFFVWMVFSAYNVYNPKKEIYKWFFYPFLIYFLISVDKSILKFSVPAIIIGLAVMSFGFVKKYLFYFFLILIFLVGFNITPFKIKDKHLWGYCDPNFIEEKILRNILYALSSELKNINHIKNISIRFNRHKISDESFNTLKSKYNLGHIDFVNTSPEFLVFSCYIITDDNFSYLRDFFEIFNYKGIKILKNPYCQWNLDLNSKINDIKLENLELSDLQIVPSSNLLNSDVELNIGYLGYYGIDLYGLRLVLKDVIVNTNYRYLITHFSKIYIKNAILNQYSLSRFFETLRVENAEFIFLNNIIKFSRNWKGIDFDVYFYPEIRDDVIYFNVVSFRVGFVKIGNIFSKALVFKIPFNSLPLKISFSKIKYSNELLKIS